MILNRVCTLEVVKSFKWREAGRKIIWKKKWCTM